jgi:ATP-dependent helicase HrpB
LARIPRYDPNRGLNTLLVEDISQASADQRAGRAGRTAPRRCVRLWSRRQHEERAPHQVPEVQRLELSEVVLALKASGVTDLRRFRWLEPPAADALASAEMLLHDLGALDRVGAITTLGRKMLAFPLHPRYARMLLAAEERQCVRRATIVAALTQGRDLLIRNPGREVLAARADLLGDRDVSDFWIWSRAWNYAVRQGFRVPACKRLGIHAIAARQVGPLLDQFLDIARREGLDTEAHDVPEAALRKCILTAFSDRLARRLDRGTLRCELVHGRRGFLARESVVHDAEFFVAAEVREVENSDGGVTTYLSQATAIEVAWLDEIFPGEVEQRREVHYDPAAKRVVAREQKVFRDLILTERRVDSPPGEEAGRVLAYEVIAGRLSLGKWDHAMDQWILRLNLLARWCPELELPAIDDEARRHLVEQICVGAVSARDLKDREVRATVQGWLSVGQRAVLDEHAPERVKLANGRTPKVVYDRANPPHFALRIQELFGVQESPAIARGKIPVVAHVLAPNMHPIQVTQDLESFWREQYPKVKQELQRKYPKHEWR